ncbi:MAG: glycoside hydrolase family 25 protein [Oscillospiraceae bacterium]|nr:glycoside hydrolase family 25 protein [Oscillospiraceae bacterium]
MGIMDVLEELGVPQQQETPIEAESAPRELVPVQQDTELTQLLTELKKPPRKLRAELVMAIIAGAAAVLLLIVVVLCMPYFSAPSKEEVDPDLLKHQQDWEPLQVTEKKEEQTQPTEETEPTIATIPPDPNIYGPYDFQYDRHNYLYLQNGESYAGVDVSAFQGDIQWSKVKASGIDFAMIRLGYRGYESGKLVKDEYAEANLEGALDAGLKIGAYFFSQALTINEVDQEIDFMLKVLGERYLEMPIVLDWEIPAATARTKNMDARTLTDLQRHFCGTMRDKGYKPMVYFNWHQSENLYYLSELEDYPFWLALYQDRMTYPWQVEMWQYSSSGTVPGIAGPVDLNVYMP